MKLSLSPRSALALSIPFALALPCTLRTTGTVQATQLQKPVTVILLRHAETVASTQGHAGPELSEDGERRAQLLAKLLAKAGVSQLYSSEYTRTRATLAPLAESLELEVEVVPAKQDERQVAALKELPPGSVAVVCGHSNTVPALASALGGEAKELEQHPRAGAVFPHDAYDRLILLSLPIGSETGVQTIELRYGD